MVTFIYFLFRGIEIDAASLEGNAAVMIKMQQTHTHTLLCIHNTEALCEIANTLEVS